MFLTISLSTMLVLIEIMLTLKVMKSHFKRSYNKQNLALEVISYELYETCRRRVSQMTTHVISSISIIELYFFGCKDVTDSRALDKRKYFSYFSVKQLL